MKGETMYIKCTKTTLVNLLYCAILEIEGGHAQPAIDTLKTLIADVQSQPEPAPELLPIWDELP